MTSTYTNILDCHILSWHHQISFKSCVPRYVLAFTDLNLEVSPTLLLPVSHSRTTETQTSVSDMGASWRGCLGNRRSHIEPQAIRLPPFRLEHQKLGALLATAFYRKHRAATLQPHTLIRAVVQLNRPQRLQGLLQLPLLPWLRS